MLCARRDVPPDQATAEVVTAAILPCAWSNLAMARITSWSRPVVAITVVVASVALSAQSDRFQFVLAVADATGRPVTDLTRADVQMSEQGVEQEIVGVEPFRMPVKLTLAVDNGPQSGEALSHYRSGLTGLVRALPVDVEVTLITISPQPRMVVRPTTDRLRILRGINEFAPEQDSPRFTDALVEFSQRLERELDETRRIDSIPVMVMVSTTVPEAVSYELPAIQRAIQFLGRRKSRVHIITTSTRLGTDPRTQLNANRQAIIGIPVTRATGGHYQALATSNRLATLLPELGAEIAAMHRRHSSQFLVTVSRQQFTGPLVEPRIEVKRPGLTGRVSLDGLP